MLLSYKKDKDLFMGKQSMLDHTTNTYRRQYLLAALFWTKQVLA